MTIHDILKKYWGHSQFRELQEEIINSVLQGNDTLALMPTGGGKSICFQVPSLAKEGICIVVSPLIALMKDQVMNLNNKGIKAVAIYSGMSAREIDTALDNCVYGNYKFLYVSPERLTTEVMQVRTEKMSVTLLAVDEAHCISQWGYDFRPLYMKIADFRKIIPATPVLALTATATSEVVKDICEKLEFRNRKIFRKSFERKNLSYSVLFEENKNERIAKMLNKVPGTAVVYVRNRRKTKEIATYLVKRKISSDYYHAGLNHLLRSQKQDHWMKNKTRAIVCTNAFGMGIDKPDVRMVVHMDVPDNIESYFQEAGRGGRDGKKSFAVLLFNNSDLIDLKERLEHGIPSIAFMRQVYQCLANYFQLAMGAGDKTSFDFDIRKFCKTYRLHPTETLQALKILEQEEYISLTDSVFILSRLMISVDKEVLYRFEVENKKYEALIRTMLRAYSGIFDEFIVINEDEIAKFTDLSREEVVTSLIELQRFNLLIYEPRKDAPQIVFTRPREDSTQLSFNTKLLSYRKKLHEKRLAAIKKYVQTNSTCRSQMLLAYFGEENAPRCGICDVCLRRNRLELSDLELKQRIEKIKKLVHEKPGTISDVVNRTGEVREEKTLQIIQWLLDNDELVLDAKNHLVFQS